jgi:hypothetical protein
MNGKVIHQSKGGQAVVLACETGDYLVLDLKQPGQFMQGDSVETQGVWLGERGKILNQRTQRGVEVMVQAISREETHAKSECDYSDPNR